MQTRSIRQKLLVHRHALLARYQGELDRAEEELDSRETEDVERATEQWDAQVLSKLGDTDARAIAGVVAALHRLEDGSYGTCEDCGGRIGRARLEALPTATTCIDCASTANRVIAFARAPK